MRFLRDVPNRGSGAETPVPAGGAWKLWTRPAQAQRARGRSGPRSPRPGGRRGCTVQAEAGEADDEGEAGQGLSHMRAVPVRDDGVGAVADPHVRRRSGHASMPSHGFGPESHALQVVHALTGKAGPSETGAGGREDRAGELAGVAPTSASHRWGLILRFAEFGLTCRPRSSVRGEGSRACRKGASAGPSPRALPGGAGRRPSRTLPADCPFLHEIRPSYATDSRVSADDRRSRGAGGGSG